MDPQRGPRPGTLRDRAVRARGRRSAPRDLRRAATPPALGEPERLAPELVGADENPPESRSGARPGPYLRPRGTFPAQTPCGEADSVMLFAVLVNGGPYQFQGSRHRVALHARGARERTRGPSHLLLPRWSEQREPARGPAAGRTQTSGRAGAGSRTSASSTSSSASRPGSVAASSTRPSAIATARTRTCSRRASGSRASASSRRPRSSPTGSSPFG